MAAALVAGSLLAVWCVYVCIVAVDLQAPSAERAHESAAQRARESRMEETYWSLVDRVNRKKRIVREEGGVRSSSRGQPPPLKVCALAAAEGRQCRQPGPAANDADAGGCKGAAGRVPRSQLKAAINAGTSRIADAD